MINQINLRIRALESLKQLQSNIDHITNRVIKSIQNGGTIITAGNGGSEANHFTTELMGRFKQNRKALSSTCLNSNSDILTCIGNDYGYENVFSHQLDGVPSSPHNLLFLFSTSGNSLNVIKAAQKAKELGIITIGISGQSGKLNSECNYHISIPNNSTAIIQEITLFLIHYICEKIDEFLLQKHNLKLQENFWNLVDSAPKTSQVSQNPLIGKTAVFTYLDKHYEGIITDYYFNEVWQADDYGQEYIKIENLNVFMPLEDVKIF